MSAIKLLKVIGKDFSYKDHRLKVIQEGLFRTFGPDGERWLGLYDIHNSMRRISRHLNKQRNSKWT